MDIEDRLDSETEQERYNLHNNCADQQGYLKHLQRIWSPLSGLLSTDAKGLDYGSGPQAVLANIISENGYKIDIWDPYFAKNKGVFSKKYDFIICNEVAEHFYSPGVEFAQINGLLNTGGFFAIGTRLLTKEVDFENWSYRRDDTHVSFYSRKSLDWLGRQFAWEWLSVADDCAIAKKLI